jgi:hypothetical protein
VEILAVLFVVGLVSLPFTRMFTFGRKGSIDNLEHIIASNLAREKMEEIKSLPFEMVKSDFDHFREMYRDVPDLSDYFIDQTKFFQKFSDIYTGARSVREDEKEVWERFKDLYPKAFLREYMLYEDELENYRRVTEVDDRIDRSHPPRLKKVTVTVFDEKGQRLAELVTLIGRHK